MKYDRRVSPLVLLVYFYRWQAVAGKIHRVAVERLFMVVLSDIVVGGATNKLHTVKETL